eukprot:scaffold96944_cov26-Tisochrysis_lutea.AAC.1
MVVPRRGSNPRVPGHPRRKCRRRGGTESRCRRQQGKAGRRSGSARSRRRRRGRVGRWRAVRTAPHALDASVPRRARRGLGAAACETGASGVGALRRRRGSPTRAATAYCLMLGVV